MIRLSLAIAVVLLVPAALPASAQELTTDAERSWRDLRNSEDVKTKLMAERWYSAIRQQEWGDASGKFKTSAKYVEHDPQLTWVKLRMIQGTGEKRVVKDVQIPLEKLNRVCQARVRQIAKLSDKVAEAIEEEKKGDEELDAADGPGDMAGGSRGGRDEYDGGRAGGDPEPVANERGRRRDRRGRAPASADESTVVTNDGPPLPALLPKPPAVQISSASTADPLVATPDPVLAECAPTETAPAAADADAWRTSYDAFRANISPPSRILDSVSFGPMTEVQLAHETMMRCESDGDVGEADIKEMQQSLDAVGEVTWEATVTGTPDQSGDWFEALGFTPPPEPIEISMILATDRDPGPWQDLKVGDRVQFVGRFASFDDEYTMSLDIRFIDVQPASGDSPGVTARR